MITIPAWTFIAVMLSCFSCSVCVFVCGRSLRRLANLLEESSKIRGVYFEALRFYADPDTWEWHMHPPQDFAGDRFDADEPDQEADSDRGEIARQALVEGPRI